MGAEENKLLFSCKDKLLQALLELTTQQNFWKEETIKTATTLAVLKTTRIHAAGTLRNIAAVSNHEQKLWLCQYDQSALLKQNLAISQEFEIRERIFALFYNLCCEKTKDILKFHLSTVLQEAMTDNTSNIKELAQRIQKFIDTTDESTNDTCDNDQDDHISEE